MFDNAGDAQLPRQALVQSAEHTTGAAARLREFGRDQRDAEFAERAGQSGSGASCHPGCRRPVYPQILHHLTEHDLQVIAPNDIPSTIIEQVSMLERILISAATGGSPDNHIYEHLRREFMADPIVRDLLPEFVRIYRNLDAFWPYIKNEAGTYAERRRIISVAFTPLMDHLHGCNSVPSDKVASDALAAFDANSVHALWAKALARRSTDPEGAITVARTLLETVTKRVLDEVGVTYSDKDDLPKLYTSAARALDLAPNQHTEEPIKAILGGAMTLVNGIGTLRNRLSDSHGRGGKLPVKPSQRHASLAVNTAGAIATFLVETLLERQSRTNDRVS